MSIQSIQTSAAFRFLGGLWLRELDADALAIFAEPVIEQAYRDLGGAVPQRVDVEHLAELATDYCQLLVGPKNAISPVQSIWQHQQYQGESAESMRQFFDLIPNYEPPSNLYDHIGVQLDFLGALVLVFDEFDASHSQEVIERYTRRHLVWSYPFLDQIKQRADTEFYVGLAKVTKNVLKSLEIRS
jgi:TorA maturation chaperone TorD